MANEKNNSTSTNARDIRSAILELRFKEQLKKEQQFIESIKDYKNIADIIYNAIIEEFADCIQNDISDATVRITMYFDADKQLIVTCKTDYNENPVSMSTGFVFSDYKPYKNGYEILELIRKAVEHRFSKESEGYDFSYLCDAVLIHDSYYFTVTIE